MNVAWATHYNVNLSSFPPPHYEAWQDRLDEMMLFLIYILQTDIRSAAFIFLAFWLRKHVEAISTMGAMGVTFIF